MRETVGLAGGQGTIAGVLGWGPGNMNDKGVYNGPVME